MADQIVKADTSTATQPSQPHAEPPATKETAAPPGLAKQNKSRPGAPRSKKPGRGPMPANGLAGRGLGPPNPNLRPAEVGVKAMGFVKVIKENFGFIGSPDLGEQLFFHASEVVKPDDFKGSAVAYFGQHFAAGDEVAFVVGTGQRGNIVGQQVKKLPTNTVKAQLLSEERFQGKVVTELNSGQWRSEDSSSGKIEYQPVGPGGRPKGEAPTTIPFHAQDVYKGRHLLKRGTLVEFSVCTDNQTQERRAVHIDTKARMKTGEEAGGEAIGGGGGGNEVGQPKLLHGFVKTLKLPSGGTIRCIEQEKRYPFKMNVANLAIGSETMFSVCPDARGNDTVASIALLPPGSLQTERVSTSTQHGRVVKPYSEAGPTPGVILSGYQTQIRFDPGPLEGGEGDASSLKAEDEVEFLMVEDYKADRLYARNIRLLAKAEEKRELGKVRTLKSNFGFIACCQRSGQVFFHFSSIQGCRPEEVQKNDDVEFSVARDPEHGTIAVRVRRMPPGTAVFETVSEEEYEGVIQTPMYNISPLVLSSGVVAYQNNGAPIKLLFGEHDFKEEKITAGEVVTFRIADNLLAAKQAEKFGATVSRLIGRRATEGKRLRIQGSVKSSNGSSGFLRYEAKGVEKKVYFHVKDVAEKLELRAGDEVAFGLAINQKTKEVNARQIVRTKEASSEPPADEPAASTPPPRAATPVRRKPLQLNNPTNSVSVAAARPTPAMPDGTRGFTFGRGVGIKPPTATPSSVPQPTGAVSIPRAPGKPANGQPESSPSLGDKTPSESSLGRSQGPHLPRADSRGQDVGRVNAEAKTSKGASPQQSLVTSLMTRTSSGRALNPAAANFMPRSASGSSLALAAAESKPKTLMPS